MSISSTPEEVKQERLRIQKNIAKWQKKLEELQNNCEHLNHTQVYGSNTGNYDPMDNSYWIEHKCELCGKYWTTEQ